jgi:hypothetical protein
VIPFAALARAAAAGARFTAADAAAAGARTKARGETWRSAMGAARGDKDLAREMLRGWQEQQKEEDRLARDRAREEARQFDRMQQEREKQAKTIKAEWTPPAMQEVLGSLYKGDPTGGARMAFQAGGQVISNDFRGLANTFLPAPLSKYLGAFDDFTAKIVERSHELEQWHGGLAVANANADIRKMGADAYEAHIAGDSYARVVDARSRFETGLQTDLAPLKDEIAKNGAIIIEGLNGIREELAPTFLGLADTLRELRFLNEKIVAVMGNLFSKEARDKELDEIRKRQEKEEREAAERRLDAPRDPLEDIWEGPMAAPPPAPQLPPFDGDRNRFGFDLFGGL